MSDSSDPAAPDHREASTRRAAASQAPQQRHQRFRSIRQRLAFWVGALLVGLLALAFAWLADHAFQLFQRLLNHSHLWPWLVTPAGFALLVWLTQGWLRNARGSGIPQVIAALEKPSGQFRAAVLAWPIALAKMILTLLALLVGASVGREGPTVHLGASVLYGFGRRLGLYERKTVSGLILAGGAAGIAAAFNTPLAGVVFAIEELSHTFEQRFSGLVLTAVVIGGMVTLGLVGPYTYFGVISASLPWGDAWVAVVICGLAGGLLGGGYARLVIPTSHGWLGRLGAIRSRFPVRFAAVCGLLVACLGTLSGQHVFGTGYEETRAILEGQPITDQGFLIWKFLANVVSYLAGIPGGLFSPSLTVGASFAPWLVDWLPDVTLQTGALLGMAAYLTGVTRTPLTSTVITLELAHSPDMAIPVLATCLLANGVSGWLSPTSLYHALAQQILHAVEPEASKPTKCD
jgi:H+/Cl- antiporter ClcA